VTEQNLPKLDVNLATLLLLAVWEDRVVVLFQARLHAVEAVELEETGAHELLGALVCSEADVCGVEFGEVLGDGLFGRGVRKVACRCCK